MTAGMLKQDVFDTIGEMVDDGFTPEQTESFIRDKFSLAGGAVGDRYHGSQASGLIDEWKRKGR